MPLLPHNSPVIILPPDTNVDDASALATVLDQHGARQILQLTRAALQFTTITPPGPTPPAPAPAAKSKPKSKNTSRPSVKPKPPRKEECNGITRDGLPCRRGPRCKMHLPPPAPASQPAVAPVVADNPSDSPPTDTDEPSEPEPPQSRTEPTPLPATEPTPLPAKVTIKTRRRCPHCQADAAMMETTRLPGNLTETRCHACGYREPAPQTEPTTVLMPG